MLWKSTGARVIARPEASTADQWGFNANTDLWKCCALFNRAFYRDERMQMGRVANALTAQRTSQLITVVLNKEVASRTEWLLSDGAMNPTKAAWIRRRMTQLGQSQAAVAMAQIFQDDLLELDVGGDMEELLESIEAETLQGELQV